MAVGLTGLPTLHPVAGVRWGTAAAGIKKNGATDVAVLALERGAHCAAVFTSNAFCAAPVTIARRNLLQGEVRYLLVNSGNANAGTGEQGVVDGEACCAALAGLVGCDASQVLPFSTGVIGETLPVDKLSSALPIALKSLNEGWRDAAHAIMTTDTVPKGASRQLSIGGRAVTITGISKGSGMIHPNMATMLAYVATDAALAPALLQSCLERAVASSFNAITVDGDTSTNDACVLVASGQGEVTFESEEDAGFSEFQAALTGVCQTLAQAIIRDGEGATKLITVEVCGGRDVAECRQVADAVALSPLVKTAFFASDPNWGRILAAVGRAGLPDFDIDLITIYLDEVCIVRGGGRAPTYTEAAGQAVMEREEITVTINLERGEAKTRVWTCDFSYDYVRINAEYRT